jgi:hypothetical protein
MVLSVGSGAQAQHVVDQGIVIENVTLISPERVRPQLHTDVVIRNGRIVEIGTNLTPGPRARRIQGSGRFLIPGLIDSHVHVGHSATLDDDAIDAHPELWAAYRAQVPRAYLAFGFTSVVDLDLTQADQTRFDANGQLFPNPIKEELPTIRELSCGGPNRPADQARQWVPTRGRVPVDTVVSAGIDFMPRTKQYLPRALSQLQSCGACR